MGLKFFCYYISVLIAKWNHRFFICEHLYVSSCILVSLIQLLPHAQLLLLLFLGACLRRASAFGKSCRRHAQERSPGVRILSSILS